MRKNNTSSGFTLAELMVVIVILSFLVMMGYADYMSSQDVMKVRLSVKEVSQSIHSARNMAINGLEAGGVEVGENAKNQSVGVYFEGNTIKFYAYDYDDEEIGLDDGYLFDERLLQDNVQLQYITSGVEESGFSSYNIFLYFPSISGEPIFYEFDGTELKALEENERILDFQIGIGAMETYPYSRLLKYYKDTYVVDY